MNREIERFVVVAFSMHRAKSVAYRKCKDAKEAGRFVYNFLEFKNADIISLRRIKEVEKP